ncbi:MAG: hypothetical protein JXN64_15725 [Spirochaetes bacterium]|nr:hypothetical protein [Spirochaetota bacterium]
MSNKINKYNVEYFKEIISITEKIIRLLQKDEVQIKLNSLKMLEDIPQLPRDSESRQLKIYKETNEVLKKLYIASARAIMQIIESHYTGIHDKTASYNYATPIEPIMAAEAIKLLPNAFIGGPVKSAINSNDPRVQRIAINYFESLPGDIRISGIFPKDFSLVIKKLEQKLTAAGR